MIINRHTDLELIPDHGRFGAIRSYDVHTGLDLYCTEGDPFYAYEDGEVINICHFTGPKAKLPWWEDTDAVLVRGNTGVILYGEIQTQLSRGDKVIKGQMLGTVMRVLKKDKGLPMCMLHVELYDSKYKGDGEIWNINRPLPRHLRNSEALLFSEYGFIYTKDPILGAGWISQERPDPIITEQLIMTSDPNAFMQFDNKPVGVIDHCRFFIAEREKDFVLSDFHFHAGEQTYRSSNVKDIIDTINNWK